MLQTIYCVKENVDFVLVRYCLKFSLALSNEVHSDILQLLGPFQGERKAFGEVILTKRNAKSVKVQLIAVNATYGQSIQQARIQEHFSWLIGKQKNYLTKITYGRITILEKQYYEYNMYSYEYMNRFLWGKDCIYSVMSTM